MYDCKNCGGELRFQIENQKLLCAHCGDVFEPSEYDKDLFAGKEEMDVTVFRCPDCGGETISTNLSAIDYCNYCGRAMIPTALRGTQKMPQKIIPFKITKAQCKKAYRNHLRKYIAIPSRLKNDAFLEQFRPVYVPYWSYDIDFTKRPILPVQRSHREGDYIITDHYHILGDLDASAENVLYDASSQLHDTIGQFVMPYHAEKRVPFNPSYLFGFYADRADTTPDLYESEAREKATDKIIRNIDKAVPGERIRPDKVSSRDQWKLGTTTRASSCTMLPMWFLTWREKEQVAYAVVNGETGKVYSDMPLSTGKFLLSSLLIAAGLFALGLFVLPTLSIYSAMLVAACMGVASLLLYLFGIGNIRRMQAHEEDIGYLSVQDPDALFRSEKKKKRGPKPIEERSPWLSFLRTLAFLYAFFALSGGFVTAVFALESIFGGSRAVARAMGYVILAILTSVILFSLLRKKERGAFRDVLGSVTAVLVALVVQFINPAQDIWYYGAMVLVALGVLWTLLSLIRQYNRVATHPEPHFFKGDTP